MREDEKLRKIENNLNKERIEKLREDGEWKKIKNNLTKERMSKNREGQKKNKLCLYREVASKLPQDKFLENEIDESLKSMDIEYLYDTTNQCQDCKAFKFKKETNFCCSPPYTKSPRRTQTAFFQKKLY